MNLSHVASPSDIMLFLGRKQLYIFKLSKRRLDSQPEHFSPVPTNSVITGSA